MNECFFFFNWGSDDDDDDYDDDYDYDYDDDDDDIFHEFPRNHIGFYPKKGQYQEIPMIKLEQAGEQGIWCIFLRHPGRLTAGTCPHGGLEDQFPF